eukprot:TRINITY_DN18030_c0_g2_i1.p1 TRINITY_DN18030_c0_g2~~TRINITY_DN18030_c0_g2_i1.p1  ORF type:complete len:635 (+),score=80.69 TRINITY_DN18030_c0_g2_i1:90-1994(+)
MHVSCRNRQIIDVNLSAVFATNEERGALAMVKSLDLGENEITHISGLQPFVSLSAIDLSSNKLVSLKGLPLGLVRLMVGKNQLSNLEGLSALPFLQELDVSHNRLTELKGLPKSSPVTILKLSHNRLPNTQGLQALSQLQILELDNNYICLTEDLKSLVKCTNLRTLTLKGNPCADHPAYRVTVAHMIPSLVTLDGQPVQRNNNPKAARPWRVGREHETIDYSNTSRTKSPLRSPRTPRSTSRTTTPRRSGTPNRANPSTPRNTTPKRRASLSRGASTTTLQKEVSHSTLPNAGLQYSTNSVVEQHDIQQQLQTQLQQIQLQQQQQGAVPLQTTRDMSFESVKGKLDEQQQHISHTSKQQSNSVGELRRLLEDEHKLTANLEKQKRKAETALSETRRVLAAELAKLNQVKQERDKLKQENDELKGKCEKHQRDYKYAHAKLTEVRDKHQREVETLQINHQAKISEIAVKSKRRDATRDESTVAQMEWEEERMKLIEMVRHLEDQNTTLLNLSVHQQQTTAVPAAPSAVAAPVPPEESVQWSDEGHSEDNTSQQIQFAVGLKKWLMSELQKQSPSAAPASQLNSTAPPTSFPLGRSSPPRASKLDEMQQPSNLEALWSHNLSLLQTQQSAQGTTQ